MVSVAAARRGGCFALSVHGDAPIPDPHEWGTPRPASNARHGGCS